MDRKRHLQFYRVWKRCKKIINILLKICVCIIFAFPFYWMISTSLKTYTESIQNPPTLWPVAATIEAYIHVIRELNLWHYIWNTLVVTVAVIALQIITVVPAAYAMAKYEYKLKGFSWVLVLSAKMVPTAITFIPVYIAFSKFSWFGTPLLNTLWPQILPFATSAFSIFLLRQNFMQVPEEIIEAARLDQCSEWKIMWKIMVPMAKSTMITAVLFSFISHWNAYFWPLVMTNTDAVKPISLAIVKLKELDYGMVWPQIMAGTFLMTLPVLILFIMASKKIIQSMAYRGVK